MAAFASFLTGKLNVSYRIVKQMHDQSINQSIINPYVA